MNRIFLGVIAVSFLISVLAILTHTVFKEKPLCQGCNVILISIDTFGAKHSSVYAPELNTTPFLEELSSRGIVFLNAYAQSSWTLPSHAAMLTGVYPWEINIWDVIDPLPEKTLTLAEVLKKEGYQTAAFSYGSFVQPLMRFDKGFDTFVGSSESSLWNDVPGIFNEASSWVKNNNNGIPFFLFIRPFELHDPYGKEGSPYTIENIVDINTRGTSPTDSEVAGFKDEYHADIKRVDNALKDFFTTLEEEGLLENTLIIITSDHGEEFNEHGTLAFHSVSVYRENIHVPLIITYPKSTSLKVPYSVEIRSIPATVLDILGIAKQQSFDGESLISFIQENETSDRTALSLTIHERDPLLNIIEASYASLKAPSEVTELPARNGPYNGSYTFSALKGPWHAIRNFDESIELYNLVIDPNEQENLGGNLLSLPPETSASDRLYIQEILRKTREGVQ